MTDENIINFIYEIGQLKRIRRTGWVSLGIANAESVADHTCRSVFISFLLAKKEGADPYRAALMSAFHESPETRIWDLHKTSQTYLNKDPAEKQAAIDQFEKLGDIGNEMKELVFAFETENSIDRDVAKDADYIECAIQAKEYIEQGYKNAQNWIDNCKKCVKTKTAKEWINQIEKTNSMDWFKDLKTIKR